MKNVLLIIITVLFALSCGKENVKETSVTQNESLIETADPSALTPREIITYPESTYDNYLSLEDAPEAFKDTPDDSEAIPGYLQSLLDGDYPHSMYCHYILGSLHYSAEEYEDAAYHFNEVIGNGIAYGGNEEFYLLMSYINLTHYYKSLEDLDTAFALSDASFEVIEDIGADNISDDLESGAYYNRAEILFYLEMYEESLTYFSNALEICAESADHYDWYEYATAIMYSEGDMDYAVKLMNTAEVYYPNNEYIFMVRGLLRIKMEEYREAFSDLMLASLLVQSGSDKSALIAEQLKETLYSYTQQNPDDDYLINYVNAVSSFLYGRYQSALDGFLDCATQYSDDPALYLYIANCYIDLEQYESALPYLKAVVQVMPKYSRIYYLYALAYYGMGETETSETFVKYFLYLDDNGVLTQSLLGSSD